MNPGFRSRPLITLADGKICHNGTPCMVALRSDLIRVGCSDITLEAAEFLLRQHRERFSPAVTEFLLQPEPPLVSRESENNGAHGSTGPTLCECGLPQAAHGADNRCPYQGGTGIYYWRPRPDARTT